MALDKSLDELNEADLAALIATGTPELKTLEYKQSLPGTSDNDRKEFFADVSSFANSAGGHLVYGMRADAGVALELMGVDADGDSAILSMENAIRDGIAPRITGIHCKSIKLSDTRNAVVMRIPKSYAAPHMVTFRNASRFYARSSNGKYQLDVHEIRAVFLGSETTADRIRDFRLDRISRIRGRETPIPLLPGPCVILHAIPLTSLSGANYDVISLKRNVKIHQTLAPLFRTFAHSSEINFDGVLVFNGDHAQPSGGYSQLYRNGIIEAVDAMFVAANEGHGLGKLIASQAFEDGLFKSIRGYLAVLKSLGVDLPILIMLSLTDVKGYTMGRKGNMGVFGGTPFDRDILITQDVLLDTYDVDVPLVMKPVVDEIWNAAGFEESLYYKDGKWIGAI